MARASASENVFRTISHPTRRALLDRLQRGGEQPVYELTEPFDVSQPALSQHLRVLREANLVESRREGRERIYRLRPEPLSEVAAWLEPYARFWRDRLETLGEHLDRTPNREDSDG